MGLWWLSWGGLVDGVYTGLECGLGLKFRWGLG